MYVGVSELSFSIRCFIIVKLDLDQFSQTQEIIRKDPLYTRGDRD